MHSRCVKRVFYSAFVEKCIDMCKHRFGVQLLQNPPLCSSTEYDPKQSVKVLQYMVSNTTRHPPSLAHTANIYS
jgi:hypothetical protein